MALMSQGHKCINLFEMKGGDIYYRGSSPRLWAIVLPIIQQRRK